LFGFFRRKLPRGSSEPTPEGYRVFTEQFDQETSASDLMRSIRRRLPTSAMSAEQLYAELQSPTPARMKAVQRSIDFQARWRKGHSLGERPLITILIDHSGSMRGPKAMTAAVAADAIGSILDHERAEFEILGFTTRSWHGGQSRALWLSRGSPEHPGRLCDLLHIVYREAGQPNRPVHWPRSLPLLLIDEVLKENVDGEALLWARRRAMKKEPTSWICLLISDGVPMDDTTVLANGGEKNGWYLNRHLAAVMEEFTSSPTIRAGCLALDYKPDANFLDVRVTDTLQDAPAQAFDVLEALIWPNETSVASD
jgi:cobaltochelatase CobT